MKNKMDIKYIAQLAKIRLTKKQEQEFSKEMSKILVFVEKLNKSDTSKISSFTHIASFGNIFREDEILPSLSQKEVLDLAPKKEGSFIKVPKIVEK